jgi:predicted RNA binding protein YcfA (HicA-like mRNA interferase family)
MSEIRNKMLKYSDLKKYLIDLGFIDESVKESHRAFRHVESGSLILLSRLIDDNEALREEDLVSVRRHLVENGLISDVEFSRFLRTGVKSATKRR